MTSAAVSAVRGSEVGIASSALNASRQAGGALGVAVIGALIAGPDIVAALPAAMGLTAIALLGVASMGLLMHTASRGGVKTGEPPGYEAPTL
jgi:DHA2 family methylenomycin A resistance protein-like MFS transporter